MSGVQMMMIASGIVSLAGWPLTNLNLTCFGLLGSTHSGTIHFNNDGTITHTASSPDSSSIQANWFSPTTAAIGSSYWIKFTLIGGSAWGGGLVSGTIYSLSSGASMSWTATTGTTQIAQVAVSIYSDAAGTNPISAGTLNADIESNN